MFLILLIFFGCGRRNGLFGLFCRHLFICLLLSLLESLFEASILHQGQAFGADTTFAARWFAL